MDGRMDGDPLSYILFCPFLPSDGFKRIGRSEDIGLARFVGNFSAVFPSIIRDTIFERDFFFCRFRISTCSQNQLSVGFFFYSWRDGNV